IARPACTGLRNAFHGHRTGHGKSFWKTGEVFIHVGSFFSAENARYPAQLVIGKYVEEDDNRKNAQFVFYRKIRKHQYQKLNTKKYDMKKCDLYGFSMVYPLPYVFVIIKQACTFGLMFAGLIIHSCKYNEPDG